MAEDICSPVNHCCSSKKDLLNAGDSFTSNMKSTSVENVRCTQRRKDGQKSSETWKSGRLRDQCHYCQNHQTQYQSPAPARGEYFATRNFRTASASQCIQFAEQSGGSFLSQWRTIVCAVVLCVLLMESWVLCDASCYGLGTTGRTILTDLAGFISDHPNESYPTHTECEWLIRAPNPDMKIMLTFSSFATECSYDFVSIYDGDSHQSPMIAALSGDSIPSTIMAESGQMLIFLYSDRNYNLRGFDATYTIDNCSFGCSGHGTCVDHSCVCESGYQGNGCERRSCPYECGNQWNQGTCQIFPVQQCACQAGFVGEGCSLSTKSNSGWGESFLVSRGDIAGLSRRAGHATVYHQDSNSLWIFGGYDLTNPLDDLIQYSFETNQWMQITPNGSARPSGRYRHVMELYDDHLFVFGGILSNGSRTNELWSFDLTTLNWELLPTGTDSVPPGMAHHSSCIVEYSYLVIIGGESNTNAFLGTVYKYDLDLKQGWEEISPTGGIEHQIKIRDHTSVYHYDTKSIVIFGGLQSSTTQNNQISKRIKTVYAFHFEDRYWTKLSSSSNVRERSYHTANIIGNYMVVYGGNVHEHFSISGEKVLIQNYGKNEKCFEEGIELYHLGCHEWVSFEDLAQDFIDPVDRNSYNITKGRFAHSAVVRDETTLLVVGGFNGVTLGDVVAIKMPGSVAINPVTRNQSLDLCGIHNSETSCKQDPECGWCSNPASCLRFSDSQRCSGSFEEASCPGICDALTTCDSCMIWGQGPQTATFDPAVTRVNKQCGWCVQDRSCYPLDEPTGYCSSYSSTPWWGSSGTFISDFAECKTLDFPPGLLWVKYKHPMNVSNPDEVSIVSHTEQSFRFSRSIFSEQNLDGNYTAVFLGFIYPMGATTSNSEPLEVFMESSNAKATLELSTDDNPENAETVAKVNKSSSGTVRKTASRKSGTAIFPDTTAGTRYYVRQEEQKDNNPYTTSIMNLQWDGNLPSSSPYQEFTSEYIQPYASDSCTNYVTCRGCLTDASCGWCPLSGTCEKRTGVTLSMDNCGTGSRPIEHYLVLDVGTCSECSQHWNCDLCTTDPLCEWIQTDRSCTRRGRFATAVKEPSQCEPLCHEVADCSDCINISNCAWCADTGTCFHFPSYISYFIHGECSHWFDSEDNVCPSCSSHQSCNDCLGTFQCGWCGDANDPEIGVCHLGDFSGPYSSSNCSQLLSEMEGTSTNITDPVDWSYAMCPDVDECRLGRHDCHGNATCINTYEGYVCECNRGYEGNGKDYCNRTCFHPCEFGYCSGGPDYDCICDLGWTGVGCNISCGCNNHSTCINGVGLCDECQDWSTGTYCQLCLPGSYGNATTPAGCRECNCHGHGNVSLGNCNGDTGVCYCTGNTVGDNCERCIDGFFGEPQTGGKCYQECKGRSVITNVHSSTLGSYEGAGVAEPNHGYCLWILTTFSALSEAAMVAISPGAIALTVDSIDIECGRDYVHVYDGIPEHLWDGFIVPGESKEIGAYCGHTASTALKATAYSGVMTIVFQANVSATSPSRGFTAIYDVRTCLEDCDGNWYCVNEDPDDVDEEGVCECQEGRTGDDCEFETCPNDCGALEGRGSCDDDLKLCSCNAGYGGLGCEYSTTPASKDAKAVWSLLYDASRLTATDLTVMNVGPGIRMGHTLVADGNGKLWLFGGFSHADGRLNDVWSFDTSSERWTSHPAGNANVPAPRNYQSAVYVAPDSMIISGGLSDREVFSDWWKFSLTSHTWTRITAAIADLEVAGHTMTMIDESTVYVVGGYSPKDGLVSKLVSYDTNSETGRYKSTTGTPPTGIFGHSAVWHDVTRSLYVFGGYRFHLQSLAVSDKLYSFHFSEASWSILPSEGYRPAARMYHSAITFADYMLVMGGFAEGEDIADTMLVYHYSCNKWQSLDAQGMSVGAEPPGLHSQSVALKDDTVYVFGGYDGSSYGGLRTVSLPNDLCSLQATVAGCIATTGCSACVGDNLTLVGCYSNEDFSAISCQSPNVLRNGTICNAAYIESRNCSSLSICSECLSVYPAHSSARQPCKWCYNCPDGACIPTAANCLEEHNCQVDTQNEYFDRSSCSETSCEASDCEKCTGDTDCIWTRQFKRSSETRRLLNYMPIYDWNCFSERLLTVAPSDYDIETVPPLSCPTLCHQHTTCSDCLSSVGADGGWQECAWSAWLNQCMSPTFLHLRCSLGECGPVVKGGVDNCPTPCSSNTQCSHCLAEAWCGWCPVPEKDGVGICLSGGLHGPTDGQCSSQEISWIYGTLPDDVNSAIGNGFQGTPQWTYLTCPPENECLNGNHNCGENENCIDLHVLFECKCKTGYERNGINGPCVPVCTQDCGENGVCVAPNQCQCNFGYVGYACTTPCQCNGHSNCLSQNATDVCLECLNNTTGEHCERCLPLFVGDPTEGGSCRPCFEHCNQNSHVCLSAVDYANLGGHTDHLSPANISLLFPVGPSTDDVMCIGCGNHSEGNKCESCVDGYFKLESVCRLCDCNGHGTMCNKQTGSCTQCQNNTMSPHCPSEEYPDPCWEHQCSQCVNDLFKGAPTDNHQCYRQMHVDQDICFDPESQTDCPIDPEPLPNGASSFFVIMPKYSDLDIRLTVDITHGAMDVYVTYDSDVFVVEYDEMYGQVIRIDEQYLSQRKRRSVQELHLVDDHCEIHMLDRHRRSGNDSMTTTPDPSEEPLSEINAHGLNTFINIEDEHFITVVRDLRDRLVITFPKHSHALTSRRFYIALVGRQASDGDAHNATQGIMYFRQDQPHIDLFIFFSVFLSCFFLFLAFLIGIWKVKVGVEARQHRRMHLLEMEHRASRPFGQVLLYYESPSVQAHHQTPMTQLQAPGKGHSLSKKHHQHHHHHRLSRIRGKGDSLGGATNRDREMEETALHSPEIVNERFSPGLIASEPTDDGMATIGTVVIALPGNIKSPVRACLGSALLTLKTSTKQVQDAQNAVRQNRQPKGLKTGVLCNTNSRR